MKNPSGTQRALVIFDIGLEFVILGMVPWAIAGIIVVMLVLRPYGQRYNRELVRAIKKADKRAEPPEASFDNVDDMLKWQ